MWAGEPNYGTHWEIPNPKIQIVLFHISDAYILMSADFTESDFFKKKKKADSRISFGYSESVVMGPGKLFSQVAPG